MNARPEFRNRLLSLLSPEDIRQLLPSLDRVVLHTDQLLHSADTVVNTIYFLESGLASYVIDLQDGATVEVGLVGNDGVTGVPEALTGFEGGARAFIQIAGEGFKLDVSRLNRNSDHGRRLDGLLLRYAAVLHAQLAFTAACNARHSLQERLARWLLMAHDRHDSDELPLTHEFLSFMLGVRRSGVTVAAKTLQMAGLIFWTRGRVEVLDRHGLEGASCECYRSFHDKSCRIFDAHPA